MNDNWITIAIRKEDYPKLKALAKYHRRTLGGQVMHMTEREIEQLGLKVNGSNNQTDDNPETVIGTA